MRKIFFALFILIFLLTACNLPLGGQSTPSVNVIATRVAGTLAASQANATISVPTQAGLPTAAGLPTVSQETATLSPTPTEKVTPTPTISPDDPVLTLGTPDFWFSPASSGDAFGVIGKPYDDNAVTITNTTDGLNFTSKMINGGKRWRLTAPQPTNFYLEGTFKVITCSEKDNYGLAMRVPSYNDSLGYYIGLSCDGTYIVDRLDLSGNGENIIGWTANANIKTGPNQVNRLGVMLINDSFKLYINGVKAAEFTDSTITAKGHVGAYVSARGDPNFTVDLQELKEWTK